MSKTDFKKNYWGSIFITIIFPIVLWMGLPLVLLIPDLVPILSIITKYRYTLMLPLFIFCCFYGLVQYLTLRKIFSKSVKKESKCKGVYTTSLSKQSQKNRTLNKRDMNNNSSSFFYILSILQDKGRFLDFISEDLSEYKDAQVGVVARLVQENCKKSIDNHFSLEHIVKEHEGETITLSHFDIRTTKFIGNITGKPPYSGVVRHRGWRIRYKAVTLPNFVAKLDNLSTIYPARIEVL